MGQAQKSKVSGKKTKTIFLQEYRRMIEELVKVRKRLKLTQIEVAEKVGWPNHSYLSKIETLEKRVDVVDLALLSKIYGKSPAYFMDFLQ
jgi:transcriptional regulator with XRE-family HTH domain